jgi:hypothetical protein
MMKRSVCVGLTMKSIDYFQHGLPILNTIPADTERIVRERGVGISLETEGFAEEAKRIATMSVEECLAMRKNAVTVYESLFAEDVIVQELKTLVTRVNEEKGMSGR